MKHPLVKFPLVGLMLLGLPWLGVLLAGHPRARYLEFPPETRYIVHAPFSWFVFCGYGLFILAAVVPLFRAGLGSEKKMAPEKAPPYPFPWWGWLGMITGPIAWILAWTRFPWFSAFQPHTFTPLWVSFILVVNALTVRRKGQCALREKPVYFLTLFPVSALFWWFFEYLNRFVQNWYYLNALFSPAEYFGYATLCFSTVLPAVLSTREWIGTFDGLMNRFQSLAPLPLLGSKTLAAAVLAAAGTGLALIAGWPDYLFALLWISPLLIVLAVQVLSGEPLFLEQLSQGDWRPVISAALAALLCGFFWEMWNYLSLARWEYSVPFVHRFQIFEMPFLGYAGYLPFGIECLTIMELIKRPPFCAPGEARPIEAPEDAATAVKH